MASQELDEWFIEQVLPLEAALMRFFRRNRHNGDDIVDLRQEVYVRAYESGAKGLPTLVKPFVFAIARNLLIDLARREQIVSIETFAEMETVDAHCQDDLTPERHASGRQELRLLQLALDELPVRCREVIQLRKIDNLSQRYVASYMGIAEDTVERQTSIGMRALANALLACGVGVGNIDLRFSNKKNGAV